MSLRQALLGLAGFVVFAFASLWVLRQALDPMVVDRCLDRGGRWDAEAKRCELEADGSGSPRVAEHPAAAAGARRGTFDGDAPAAPVPCDTLSGDVRHGEIYERRFGGDLLFRLRPSSQAPPNPEGWTIEVLAAPDYEVDRVWVATPPYRFANPRDLTTSYGHTARDVVTNARREFAFATGEEEYEALAGLVDTILWRPEEMAQREYDAVLARWRTRIGRAGRGELTITDAEVAAPDADRPLGRIERVAFSVMLCAGGEDPSAGDSLPGD